MEYPGYIPGRLTDYVGRKSLSLTVLFSGFVKRLKIRLINRPTYSRSIFPPLVKSYRINLAR